MKKKKISSEGAGHKLNPSLKLQKHAMNSPLFLPMLVKNQLLKSNGGNSISIGHVT